MTDKVKDCKHSFAEFTSDPKDNRYTCNWCDGLFEVTVKLIDKNDPAKKCSNCVNGNVINQNGKKIVNCDLTHLAGGDRLQIIETEWNRANNCVPYQLKKMKK
jgi:hypothetical protein